MPTLTQPHRTRGDRPGYRPIALTDITIRIHATPGIDVEVWRALHADVDVAIDASLKKHGLAVCVARWLLNAEAGRSAARNQEEIAHATHRDRERGHEPC